ncbi:MAG: SMC-Scp complex subunit ScpB [Elusimicrobia bacterium]|nr:SMC-Scp complex subunit ScpB [Elusimicrobiota bacterium]
MDKEKIKSVLEALLFVTIRPLTLIELCDIVGETQNQILELLAEIKNDFANRKSALQIVEAAEGYQLGTCPGFSYWVKKLFKEQTTFRLSQSALETLSIVAYKQPITRAEIEEIRGVEVIGVLETLLERKLVKIAGRKESVGRPLLYGTTAEFLRHFNLWKISELPSLEDLAKEQEREEQSDSSGKDLPVEEITSESQPASVSQSQIEKGSEQNA